MRLAANECRETIDLDGTWEFIPDPERLYEPTDLPKGQPIAVPGCWEAQVARPYRIVAAWYRRSIDIPADWIGDRAVVAFQAVMYRCVVYLNGVEVGAHEGGYTPFDVNLSEAVRPGASNELVVHVVNPLNAIEEYPALIPIPEVEAVADAHLRLAAIEADGRVRASDELRLAILPATARRTAAPLRIAIHDPLDIWGIGARLSAMGHDIVDADSADLIVASELTDAIVNRMDAGGRALILVRSRAAIPENHDLARRVGIHLRRLAHSGWPGQRSPWEGDWVTSWSWILRDQFAGLPERHPLDFAYEAVLPDHVLLGHDPERHRDEVTAGMFVGWIHTPAALIWEFLQGRGSVTLTTFRVAPESGPVATVLLEGLLQRAAVADRRVEDRGQRARGGASREAGDVLERRPDSAVRSQG